MQTITRGQANTVTLTLTERVTISNPVFLVKCTSRSSRGVKCFILQVNASNFTYRYDQFTITESATEDLINGTVELKPAGDWDYEIYQQADPNNLDITKSISLLEQGIFRVIGSSDTTNYYDGNQKNITYYSGN